jgi:hypothetical protein
MEDVNIDQYLEEYGLNPEQVKLIKTIVAKTKAVSIRQSSPGTRGTRLPEDWKPTRAVKEWTLSQDLTKDEANLQYEKFKDYWLAKSGKDATKVDWDATWRNWIRSYLSYRGGSQKRYHGPNEFITA